MQLNVRESKKPKINRWIPITLAVLLTVIAFEALVEGSHVRFYQKWNECGQKPLATAGTGLMGVGANHYYTPPVFRIFTPNVEYFCTPLEAERAGYSASPDTYDFPHLRDSGE